MKIIAVNDIFFHFLIEREIDIYIRHIFEPQELNKFEMANAFSIYLNENIKVRLIVQQYKMPEYSFEKAFFL